MAWIDIFEKSIGTRIVRMLGSFMPPASAHPRGCAYHCLPKAVRFLREVASRRNELPPRAQLIFLGGFCRSFAGREMCAKFGRRLAEDSPEGAIELGERLEPDIVSNLADSRVRIQQPVPGILQAHARDIVGELKSRALAKNFAEMKHACARRFGDIGQR